MLSKRKKKFLATVVMLVITCVAAALVYTEIAGIFSSKTSQQKYVLPPGGKIAFVKPIFTTTAYQPNGFYTFYSRHPPPTVVGTYITTDLSLLTLKVQDDWGWSKGLDIFINSNYAKSNNIILGNNSFVLSDIDINNGALFYANGSRAYDVVVIGFDEYVTDNEFYQYLQFAQNGGRIIFLDAATFLGKVAYNQTTNKITFIESHGYYFNGTVVSTGLYDHYNQQNAEDFGSTFSFFKAEGYSIHGLLLNTTHPLSLLLKHALGSRIITTYQPHEENAMANLNDQPIGYWALSNTSPSKQDLKVAAYQLNLGNGTIIQTGIFGSDIIDSNADLQLFLVEAIGIATPQISSPVQIFVDTDQYVHSVGDNFSIFGNVSASVIVGVNINIQITAPDGSLWGETSVALNPDGSFQVDSSSIFHPLDQVGNYTITAYYNGVSASANFTVIPAQCTVSCDATPTS